MENGKLRSYAKKGTQKIVVHTPSLVFTFFPLLYASVFYNVIDFKLFIAV